MTSKPSIAAQKIMELAKREQAARETTAPQLDFGDAIKALKAWWFTVRWCWIHRNWSPTRQKLKAYTRDLEAYRKTGRKPF